MKNREFLRRYIITAGLYYSFLIFGFIDNLKGPMLPVLLEDFSLTYTQGSNLLLMIYLGFMLSILASGYFAGKFGNTRLLMFSGIIISAASAVMSLISTLQLMYPTLMAIGISLGAIEVGANGGITDLYSSKSGRYLNILAIFHGAGAMTAPWLAGKILEAGNSWQSIYRGSLLPVIIFPLIFILFRSPSNVESVPEVSKAPPAPEKTNINFILLMAIMLLYVSSEIGLASWIVEYMYRFRGLELSESAVMLTLFWAAIMTGRITGSILVEKTSYINSLVTASILALITFSLGLLPFKHFYWFLPATGLFFAIIFPTTTALASQLFPGTRNRVFSSMFFFAGLGGMAGPWVVGFFSDLLGLRTGFSVISVSISGIFLILLVLRSQIRSQSALENTKE